MGKILRQSNELKEKKRIARLKLSRAGRHYSKMWMTEARD